MSGFKKFLLRGNLVDLAVAFVIGAAFSDLVKALVKDFITPLLGVIGGKGAFGGRNFTIHNSVFAYGTSSTPSSRSSSWPRSCTTSSSCPSEPARPLQEGAGARRAGSRVPRVPEQHPGGSHPLHVLHRGLSPGLAAADGPAASRRGGEASRAGTNRRPARPSLRRTRLPTRRRCRRLSAQGLTRSSVGRPRRFSVRREAGRRGIAPGRRGSSTRTCSTVRCCKAARSARCRPSSR